jgi:mannose-6-phosphate isomerase-like protein (cupin superfamily)
VSKDEIYPFVTKQRPNNDRVDPETFAPHLRELPAEFPAPLRQAIRAQITRHSRTSSSGRWRHCANDLLLNPHPGAPMSFPPIHRVVTGHDADGKSVVTSNGPLPTVIELKAIPGTVFHEVWSTTGTPAPVDNGADPSLGPLLLPPPKHGSRIRFVDIPPDTADYLTHGAERMTDAFAQIGDAAASTVKKDSPHPLIHRTESVDYGIVIEGELTLVLDDAEVLLKPGAVVVQRGTNHAWANRSGQPCRMLFVLVDGQFEPALAAALAKR